MLAWINKKRNKKGFTLVELVVVIAILGILIALAVPRLTGFIGMADEKQIEANAKLIATAGDALLLEGKYPDPKDVMELAGLTLGESAIKEDGLLTSEGTIADNHYSFTYELGEHKVVRNATSGKMETNPPAGD